MSDETKVQKSTNADGNSVSQPIAKPLVSSRQILLTIKSYETADNFIKNKVDTIVSLLEGIDICQAKSITRIADSFVYRVGQQKLEGVSLID